VAATTGPTDALGKNRFLVSSEATNTNGIVGAWAITNTLVSGNSVPDYATYNGSGYVVPLGAAALTDHAGLVAAGAGANVNFGGSTTLDLAALRTLNTLRITNSAGTPTINLNAFNLETFGILSAGGGGAAISQGTGSGFLTIPTATPGGAIGESANLYISNSGRASAISVAIKDNGASKLTLVKSGLAGVTSTGTLQLNNTGNSYSGDTVVNEGDLNLGASNVIPDGASKGNLVLDGSNARFLMTPQTAGTAFSETINGLNGRGTVLSNATSGTSTLTVGSGDANGNFSGTLINGGVAALALTKTGAGTQTLSGANTYTGATNVNGGKLVVNGSISTSTLTTVAASATLGGNGTVGKTIINGTLAVGNSPGTMTFTDTLGLTGATIMEIDGTSGAGVTGGHDFVNLTGSGAAGVLTTGGTMTLDMGVIFSVGSYSWDLFDMASETGTFTSISLADQYSGSLINTSGVWDLTSGDNTWQFTESTGVLGLTVIPEPRAALLGGLGLLALLRRRR
jgi:autotransporter-associated beta strand protein